MSKVEYIKPEIEVVGLGQVYTALYADELANKTMTNGDIMNMVHANSEWLNAKGNQKVKVQKRLETMYKGL